MQTLAQQIASKHLQSPLSSLSKIQGFGSVNTLFEAQTAQGSFIIRLNEEPGKWLEYRKENWCLDEMSRLGIPGPNVLHTGQFEGFPYQILEKLPGKNGKSCSPETQAHIWKKLGEYASKFQRIPEIEDAEVKQAAFHADWRARLAYNLEELHETDSLLTRGFLSAAEHQASKEALIKLKNARFQSGLVHGDLCPRNVLVDGETVYLLDWGTAEIDVVPHMELGKLLLSEEASEADIRLFLKGMGISPETFQHLKGEINLLNVLHNLDVYRWAEGNFPQGLERYAEKVKKALRALEG